MPMNHVLLAHFSLLIGNIANPVIDFYGSGARNGFTSGFTASDLDQTWNVPHKFTHIPLIHLSLSVPIKDFHHNPRITEINSFIDAKSAPD